ncbi:DUF192 domain-containing protein [Fontisphaera persica]|uniref:DUF192 domain-containing protein n=1 Tax=Fontisphaera persica TaxID=2974023 RepID=UPI0024BFDDD2|nr:DUF192 domain-containing protein [Fontisphaera persica]WCJ58085.1 DUF192 domain-containing protein [Fontisphaera persica]
MSRNIPARKPWCLALAAGLTLAAISGFTGCDAKAPPPAAPPAAEAEGLPRVTPEGHLDRAQPKLRTMRLYVGAHELITELCTNDVQRMTGMMFRTNLAENEAMLFVFPWPHRASFYMKNTRVPLSAAYLDPEGVIREIHDLHPGDLQGKEAKVDNIQYVLETTQGWFQRRNLGPGAVVRTEEGTLPQTFFKRR